MTRLTALLSLTIITCGAADAAVTAKKDPDTGNTFYIVADTPGMNCIGYPTCQTWSRDSKSLFIESTRPNPDGTYKHPERQLLQVDIADGNVKHISTLQVEDTSIYGKAHRSLSSAFHADYSPGADILVYYDMSGHNMYLTDLQGRHEKVVHEPQGTFGCPPSISRDGKRIVYYVLYPVIENRYFTDVMSVIFALDVDPKTLKAIGKPRVVVAYPGRKGPDFENNPRDKVHADHCQINPVDNDHIVYAHDFSGCERDGSLLKSRVWQVRADGSGDKPVVIQHKGEGQTHEVFSPKGDKVYFVDRGYVYSADFTSQEKKLVFDGRKYGGCHVAVSPDERYIALDMWLGGESEHGNPMSGILLVDLKTGKERVLCKFPRLAVHPGHPHPNFSPDGKKIAFNTAEGANTKVAYVVIDECK